MQISIFTKSVASLASTAASSPVSSSKIKGFTLIEIMVALAVLALSGVALLGNIGQATRDLSIISDKADALHIAEYALNMALLEETFPELSNEEETITHAGREWRVDLTVSDTPNAKVRRIDVMVRPNVSQTGSGQSATILLSGFRGDIF